MIAYHDKEYLKMVQYILDNGYWKDNRTGVQTLGVFGYQMRFDLSNGSIPLLTTKKMHVRSIIHELLWYLMGTGNIKYLHDNNVTTWDEWAPNGYLGPVYGVQWRKWKTPSLPHKRIPSTNEPYFTITGYATTHYYSDYIDQINQLIDKLKNNPDDRRMIVSAWNVAELDDMALPPCHYSFQCYVLEGRLSMILNQRSCDVGLGVPFNIVQYSLLLRMLAHVTGLLPGEFIWNGGDVHIYENHIDALTEQLTRKPYPSPTFDFARPIDDIDSFQFDDFIIKDYVSHDRIVMEVAV